MGGSRVGICWFFWDLLFFGICCFVLRTGAEFPHLFPTQAVLLCLLDLLPILQRCQRHQGQARATTSPWDQVLQLVLTHMEAEHGLALRRVYAGSLPAFVSR